jgi:hypothetical protein
MQESDDSLELPEHLCILVAQINQEGKEVKEVIRQCQQIRTVEAVTKI